MREALNGCQIEIVFAWVRFSLAARLLRVLSVMVGWDSSVDCSVLKFHAQVSKTQHCNIASCSDLMNSARSAYSANTDRLMDRCMDALAKDRSMNGILVY